MKVEKMLRKELKPLDLYVWRDAFETKIDLGLGDLRICGFVQPSRPLANAEVYRITLKEEKK